MRKIILLIFLILIVICAWFFYPRTKIQYVEDCGKALNDTGRDYIICSMDANGRLYLTNDKRVFRPDEYLGLHLNVQKLNKYFDHYYMCLYSNLPCYQDYEPNDTHKENKRCVKLLYFKNDYNSIRFSAYVADLPGKYTLAEIYLFPEVNFTSKEEFFNNLDQSILAFKMTGEIK
jgi:hypothetical protein